MEEGEVEEVRGKGGGRIGGGGSEGEKGREEEEGKVKLGEEEEEGMEGVLGGEAREGEEGERALHFANAERDSRGWETRAEGCDGRRKGESGISLSEPN